MQLFSRHSVSVPQASAAGASAPRSPASRFRALDDEAHDAAAAVGLRVARSRRQAPPGVYAGYMLVEPTLHTPVFGSRFDKTAQEVIDFCRSVDS